MAMIVERPCPFVLMGFCSRPDCQNLLDGTCCWFNEIYTVRTSDSTAHEPQSNGSADG